MKFLPALLFALLPMLCFANTDTTIEPYIKKSWEFTAVADANKKVIGYVYTSSAYGYIDSQRTLSNMRLICSTKENTDLSVGPVVAIAFKSTMAFANTDVSVKVDGKKVNLLNSWVREGNIIYRKLSESKELISAMQKGKIVSFEFDKDGKNWTTAFSINDFADKLKEFEVGCGIK